MVIDHNRNPRNFGRLNPADRKAEGYNPLCGDELRLYLRLEGERISDLRFEGQGCAISTASASLMTESVKGLELPEAQLLLEYFLRRLTGRTTHEDSNQEDPSHEDPKLGKLEALTGVQEFPSRVKCATLCWHTLRAVLDQSGEIASSE